MELRPGYKLTEVGVLPEDWRVVPLEDIAVKEGLVRGPFGSALKKEFFVKQGYKVYEQRNAIYRTTQKGDYFIAAHMMKALSRFQVQPGNLIVSCSGTIGCIYKIPIDAPLGVINQALLKITLDERFVDSDFFLFQFRSAPFQERITENSHGGAMQNLVSMEVFKRTPLPLPPSKAEQQAIAITLTDVDTLISSLDTLTDKKRAIKQAVMQQLLSREIRLPGYSGEWEVKTLGQTAILKARIGWQGLTTAEYLDSGDYYLVTGTDFSAHHIDWDNCHYVDESRYKQDKNIQLMKNDVLVTKDGTIGKVAFVDQLEKPATLNSGVFVIRPIEHSFHPLFFYYLLRSNIFSELPPPIECWLHDKPPLPKGLCPLHL
jgi:type I restriction enzyme S subunit